MRKSKKFSRWAVADCETDSFDGQTVQPFLWALITSEGERLLTYSTVEFIEYLKRLEGLNEEENNVKNDILKLFVQVE